ncbi:MAG: hypothetical protein HZC42_15025 [Candidatus Eisenbacteria bacterium]|nr:hypothetical protein [Candidatus Eisenbacteria bacterium]
MSRPAGRSPVLLLVPGALALLAGLWSGLARLGWDLPPLAVAPGLHGPLMIGGFLGTVIGLERAVALTAMTRRRWAYVVPASCGLGGLALLFGALSSGRVLIALGSAGLAVVFAVVVRTRPDRAHVVMGLGALAWLAGNLLWFAGAPLAHAAAWWVGFLVLTIAGERLELARLVVQAPGPQRSFTIVVAVLLAGLALSLVAFAPGLRVAGAGAVALGLWLLRHDLARRTIRARGVTRYIAACLLPGYAWLVFAGALWLAFPARFDAGPLYDAMLHAVLVGFVFSMIFGHAPIILPALTGAQVAFHPRFYGHVALLHAGLIVRIAGDLAGAATLRQWGGLANVAAILMFLASTLAAVASARRRGRPSRATGAGAASSPAS